MELDKCINFLLSTAQHNVFQYLSGRLASHGITPGQYGVLNCLWTHRELTPKQIGELLHLEASSVSGLLDRMQKNDLIERTVDPENRRVVRVSLTQKALDIQPPIEQIIDEMNAHVLETFSPAERETLLCTLSVISNRVLN
ncbi:MAG: MarR family transcriptional regulator [Oscillospiraceae bacterium]|jgi:DNA-binding MarR family transcriptional regulator|nr:MarR family transcriptional regulator [Oscillospiraceae bacterium]